MAKPNNVNCVSDTMLVRMPTELINLLDKKVVEKNNYYQKNNIKKKATRTVMAIEFMGKSLIQVEKIED